MLPRNAGSCFFGRCDIPHASHVSPVEIPGDRRSGALYQACLISPLYYNLLAFADYIICDSNDILLYSLLIMKMGASCFHLFHRYTV